MKMQDGSTPVSPASAPPGGWHLHLHLGLFVLALVGTLAVFGFLLRESHAQAVAKATTDSANLAKVLERQLDTSLRRLDADLQAMAGRLRPPEMQPEAAARHRDEWTEYLDSLKVNFNEVKDFLVIDAKGDVLFSSGVPKSFNVAERPHFKQVLADPDAKMVWSDVIAAKTDGQPTIVFARGVRDSSGKFLGAVSALVDLDYFQKAIAAIDIGPQGLIYMRDTQSYKLLLRQPSLPSMVNKSTKSTIFDRILQGERQGFERFTSPLDGKARYTSFLVLNGYPFVVAVALSEGDVLAAWRSQVLISLVIAGMLLLSLGLVLWQLWRAELARRQSMAALVAARDSAEAASRSKGQFLANMSHEIRTPMNAILGMLALLQKTALTARQADYAGKTEGAARALLSLLNDILDFSKVDAGKMLLDPQPFRFDQLLQDLSVILAANIGSKDVELLFDIDPALPRSAVGDVTRLQQVLINLGGNALKFTERGEVVVSIAVVARSEREVTLEIAVRDSGIGIAPENQQRIFSGFTQAEATTTRRFGGTGLGLAICQRLVALLGGTLKLDSALGAGSRFHFQLRLPVAEAPADGAAANRGTRVLFVDDNPTARDVLQRTACGLGWLVETVDSGESALRRLRESAEPFDAVFVDGQMPGLDGWQTCRQIRDQQPARRAPRLLMMVTVHGLEMLAQRPAEEQPLLSGYLVKPLTGTMLSDALADARGQLRPSAEARSEPAAAARRLAGLRLLVAEDNANNQQVARELLEGEGAEVQIAVDGSAAVAAVATAEPPFDAVLMDLQMPVMDGYTATGCIRQDLGQTSLPIIAMTANAMASDRDACLAAGMDAHIGKPFDLDDLVRLLRRLTGRGADDTAASAESPPAPVALAMPPQVRAVAAEAGVDLAAALARMSGQSTVYARVLRNFCRDLAPMPAQLAQHVAQGAFAEARLLTHSLKGAAATLGADGLAAEAGHAESFFAAAPGSVDGAHGDRTVRRLAAAVDAALPGLARLSEALTASLRATSPPAGPAAPDAAALVQALRRLAQALDESDMHATALVQELQDRHAVALGASLQPLDEAVAALDFSSALGHCKRLIEEHAA